MHRRRIYKSSVPNLALEDDNIPAVDPSEGAAPDVTVTTATATIPSTADAPAVDPATAAGAASGTAAPAVDTPPAAPAAAAPDLTPTPPAADGAGGDTPTGDTPAAEVPTDVSTGAPADTTTPAADTTPAGDDGVPPADTTGAATDESATPPADDASAAAPEITDPAADVVAAGAEADLGADVPAAGAEAPSTDVPDATSSGSQDATAAAASAAAASLAGADLAPDSKVIVVVVEPTVSPADNAELDDLGDDVEASVDEADSIAQEAEEVLVEVADIIDAVDELADIQGIVADATETGGLSDDGVKMLEIATESIYRRLGVNASAGVPALESFQGKSSRIGSSQIAMESISANIKAFGKTVLEGLKKVWEFIKKFFNEVLTATGRLEARAKKVQGLAKGFQGKNAGTLKNGGIARRLVVGTGVPTDLVQGLSALNDFVASATSGQVASTYTKLTELVGNIANSAKGTKENRDASLEALQHAVDNALPLFKEALNLRSLETSHASYATQFGAPGASAGTELRATPIFPGNNIIWAHVPTDAAHVLDLAIGKVHSDQGDKAENLTTLTGDQLGKIAEQALRFVQHKREFDSYFSVLDKSFQTIVKLAYHLSVEAAGDTDAKALTIALKAIRVVSALYNGVHHHALSEGMRTHNATLDYAQLVLGTGVKKGTAPARLAGPQAKLPAPAAKAA